MINYLENKIFQGLINGDDTSDLEAILILFLAGKE